MQTTAQQTTSLSKASSGALLVVMMVLDSMFFIWARLLLPHFSPRISVLYVMLIGAVEVGIVALLQKRLRIKTFIQYWWFFLLIGILIAASTYINYEAVAFVDPGTASMLNQFSIVFGLVWGLVWLKEKLTTRQVIGAVIAIAGVVTITFQKGDYFRLGSLMVLGSALMYSFHAAFVKRYGSQLHFFEFFTFRLLSTALFSFASAGLQGSLAWPPAAAWPLLLLIATFDIAVGRSLYYLALRRFKVSLFSILFTLSPLLTVIWSRILFGVVPTWVQVIGGLGVIAGVLVVTWKTPKPA